MMSGKDKCHKEKPSKGKDSIKRGCYWRYKSGCHADTPMRWKSKSSEYLSAEYS